MLIEYMKSKYPSCGFDYLQPREPFDVEQTLLSLDGTLHNRTATTVLCAASAWAYSDLGTFASMMCSRGLYGEFVGITVMNNEAFADTTAYLFLSHTKHLAILAFRGTELLDPIDWLGDISVQLEPQEEGEIHGGFLNAVLIVLPVLKHLLRSWSDQRLTLAEALCEMRRNSCYPDVIIPPVEQLKAAIAELTEAGGSDRPEDDSGHEARAFYITGHSLGGAYASMASALVYRDPELRELRRKLRSIYTFGAPMFANRVYANSLDAMGLGSKTFRHRYENDIVPRLPSRSQGDFKHFGQAFESARRSGWIRSTDSDEPVLMALLAMAIGLLPFLTESALALAWIRLPYSWPDHKPTRYLSQSQTSPAGWAILG